jgi:hypothetical protein
MRWFLMATVATVALVLADPSPVKAQIIIGGYQIGGPPAYTPRYYVPYTPYTRVVTPATTEVIPVNGGPVDFALNTGLRSLGSVGYGPYAPYYGYANPANYVQWSPLRPFNAPTVNWKAAQPWNGNPGLRKGWFKGR